MRRGRYGRPAEQAGCYWLSVMENTKNSLSLAFGGVYRGKRVLVTGHTGFKGSWLCEWLLSLGAEVTGLALPPPTEPALFEQLGLAARLRHIEGDIRDAALVRRVVDEARPDFVFHLAAQPLVRLSYEQPVETYATNIMGTVNVLDALRHYQNGLKGAKVEGLGQVEGLKGGSNFAPLQPASTSVQPFNPSTPQPHHARVIAAVMVTTDKCYENKEWVHSYREEDPMGGYDPYSSSKGAAELVIAAYRRSYFSPSTVQPFNDSTPQVRLASARAGNVIGGGDWALDRIVPDCVRALQRGEAIPVRNKVATRPWQHVLEPLSGYLWLAASLAQAAVEVKSVSSRAADFPESDFNLNSKLERLKALCSAFNFGPALSSNRTVKDLVEELLKHWPGHWEDRSDPHAVHEAKLLNLATDKAHHFLGWQPVWDFPQTLAETAVWYRSAISGATDMRAHTLAQIGKYVHAAMALQLSWTK